MDANEYQRSTRDPRPILVLLPAASSFEQSDGNVRDRDPVLGLSLIQRTLGAARRADYGAVYFLVRDNFPPPGVAVIPDWSRVADALAAHPPVRLIIAPVAILAQIDWLERLARTRIEPAAWAAIPHRIVVVATTSAADACAALDAQGGAYSLAAVEERLSRRFGPAVPLPVEIDPMLVLTSKDIPVAELRLLRALVKESDGFMARHVERPISLQISRYLARTAVTPNQITIMSVVIGLCGSLFFLSPAWFWQTVGALLFLLHSIVDGCDGELARLKFQESRYGGMLDFWGDNVVHVAVFGCMALGWSLSSGSGWPLLLGAAATIGTLASAAFVYWHQMRGRSGSGPLFTSVSSMPRDRLARLLDAGARRDFIYLVLVLALLGRSSWFVLLAAVGAPTYFLLLTVIAARDHRQNRATTT